jgi:hypothetical protein
MPTAITAAVNSTPSRPVPTTSKVMTSSSTTSRQPGTPVRRTVPASPSSTVTLNMSDSPSIPRTKPVAVPSTATSYTPSAHPGYPVSPRSRPSQVSSPDPHPHPTPAPKPASALSMYQVAHRYAMPALATLALEHMMNTITPQSSFALLLATSVWEELHLLIEVCVPRSRLSSADITFQRTMWSISGRKYLSLKSSNSVAKR